MSARRPRPLRVAVALAVSAGLVLGAAACAPAEGQPAEGESTLTVQFVGPPLFGMNPAKTGGGTSILYASAAYDSLLFMEPDGSFSPDLATEWGYIGDDNMRFELTIREGVTFTDGEELDAEAVKKSLEYVRDGGFFPSVQLEDFESIEVTGDYTLEIAFSEPLPNVATTLSQNGIGFIISPAAIDTPEILDTETVGAGPYVLDTEETVVGSTYVYTRNEDYWNPDAVKVDKLVVQAIGDANTTLSAIQTGQVDVSLGAADTAAAAEQAGLTVISVGGAAQVLSLLDRNGTIVPALADPKVRQAINFAVDREGITAAVGGEYADPLQQIITPGRPGFDEDLDETYRHDPEEARALLEEAGWGDGFELQVTCVTLIAASCKIAEAVASDLDEVGITVRIDELTGEVQAFDDKLRSGQTPAAVQGHGGDTDRVFARLGMPTESPTSANPFQSSDEELAAIYDEAVRTSDPDEQDELWKQASARMQELGWFVPLYVGRNLFYVSPKVQGFEVSDANPVYTPVDPFDGSSTWYLG